VSITAKRITPYLDIKGFSEPTASNPDYSLFVFRKCNKLETKLLAESPISHPS
jgi:hypothetical protein